MRLLQLDSQGQFTLSKDLATPPGPYAILSHTWGEDNDEVTFDDIMSETGKNKTGRNKTGYTKLRFCAKQAREDGLGYFWIDTCCINKANRIELSKAIRSMFDWYRNSAKCYVYLSDVSVSEDWVSAFRASRWFTRGWTLQELLAPASVEFFSVEEQKLGHKEEWKDLLHEITGIPISAICNSQPLGSFSAAEKFRWGAKRVTKHKEDQVFCLLGIFDIDFDMSRTGQGRAYAQLFEALDRSSQRQYDWNVWPSLEYSLGHHTEMFQDQDPWTEEISDDPDLGPLVKLIQIAAYLMEHSKLKDAEELLKYGLEDAEKTRSARTLQGAAVSSYIRFFFSRLGNVYWELRDLRAAEGMYRKAIRDLHDAEKHRSFVYETYNNLGMICASDGREDIAESYFQYALRGRQKLVKGIADTKAMIWVVRSLNNLGLLYHQQHNFCAEEQCYEKALSRIMQNQVMRNKFKLEELEIRANMGRLYTEQAWTDATDKAATGSVPSKQRLADAKGAFILAIEAWKAAGTGAGTGALTEQQRNHPQYLLAVQGLGNVHFYLGDDADAVACFRYAFEGHSVTRHIHVCESADALARAYYSIGDSQAALGVLREALNIVRDDQPEQQGRISELEKLHKFITQCEERRNLETVDLAAEDRRDTTFV